MILIQLGRISFLSRVGWEIRSELIYQSTDQPINRSANQKQINNLSIYLSSNRSINIKNKIKKQSKTIDRSTNLPIEQSNNRIQFANQPIGQSTN
jgi:hypothetical protein